MVVVFTIVSSVQEKLNQIVEQLAEEEQREAERRQREVEEAEQVEKSTLWCLSHLHSRARVNSYSNRWPWKRTPCQERIFSINILRQSYFKFHDVWPKNALLNYKTLFSFKSPLNIQPVSTQHPMHNTGFGPGSFMCGNIVSYITSFVCILIELKNECSFV